MSHEGIRFVSAEDQARIEAAQKPLTRATMTPAKVRVLITEGKGLEIDWQDGHKSAWDFKWLRNACPCATCIEERNNEGRKAGEAKYKKAELLPMYTAPAKPASAQAVGRYAIQLNWQDGHSAGIYSWEYLRRHCQCGECALVAAKVSGVPN
jgi:DUF971 family protein